MNKLPMLIRREFWEHRNTFVILPLVITGFMFLVMVLAYLLSTSDFVTIELDFEEHHGSDVELLKSDNVFTYLAYQLEYAGEGERTRNLASGLNAMASPFLVSMWFVVFLYLLDSLYTDRRDRSILFWKSLPVSDAMTVTSKLLTGLLLVPLIYLAGVAVVQFSALLLLSVATSGTEISATEVIWQPASILSTWFMYLSLLLFYAVWALPFFAWLLVVSAFAKSAPLAWAAGVPLAIAIVERIFTSRTLVSDWMGLHAVPITFIRKGVDVMEMILSGLGSLQMLSAVVVGAILLYAATWLRGRADEI